MGVLWDMKVQTDREIEHFKPGIVILDETGKTCMLVDVACLFDTSVPAKERKKLKKYYDLKLEAKGI